MEKICVCKSIRKESIIEAIKKGSDTYEKIQRETGAGRGACKGHRCKCKIEQLINDEK